MDWRNLWTICCGIVNKYMTRLSLTIYIQILQLYLTASAKKKNMFFFFEEEAYLCVAFPE